MTLCCDWSGSFVTSSRHRDFRRHQRRTSRGWEMTHWTLGHQLSTENSAQNIWRLDGKMNVISLFFLALLADLSYYYIVWQLELIHVKTTRYHIKQLKKGVSKSRDELNQKKSNHHQSLNLYVDRLLFLLSYNPKNL